MKGLRRILLHGLAALSGVLFIATAAFWLESRWRAESFAYLRNLYQDGVFTEYQLDASSGRRGIEFGYFYGRRHIVDFVDGVRPEHFRREFKHDRGTAADQTGYNSFIGFGYYSEHVGRSEYPLHLLRVIVPYWFLLLLFAAAPVV